MSWQDGTVLSVGSLATRSRSGKHLCWVAQRFRAQCLHGRRCAANGVLFVRSGRPPMERTIGESGLAVS